MKKRLTTVLLLVCLFLVCAGAGFLQLQSRKDFGSYAYNKLEERFRKDHADAGYDWYEVMVASNDSGNAAAAVGYTEHKNLFEASAYTKVPLLDLWSDQECSCISISQTRCISEIEDKAWMFLSSNEERAVRVTYTLDGNTVEKVIDPEEPYLILTDHDAADIVFELEDGDRIPAESFENQ